MKQQFHLENSRGSTLVLSMLVIAVVTALVGVIYNLTTTTIVQTERGTDYAIAQAAAEGAIEYAYGLWVQEITNNKGPISTTRINTRLSNPPSLPGVTYKNPLRVDAVDEYGAPIEVDKTKGISMDSRQFPGWRSYEYNYVASVTVSVPGPGGRNTDFSLKRNFIYSNMPVFGAMFFFEGHFELFYPAPMRVNGHVHTNSNGYVSTHYSSNDDKLRFESGSRISHVGNYNHAEPPNAKEWSSYPQNGKSVVNLPIYEDGFENQVKKSDYMEALGTGSADEFDTSDNNPNNDGNREIIEPPNPNFTDPPAIAASRLYNKAGLIVEIGGPLEEDAVVASNNNFVAKNLKIMPKNGTAMTLAQAQAIRNAITNSTKVEKTTGSGKNKKTAITYPSTQITDKREAKLVDVSTVDLGEAGATLNNLTDFNGVLYIHDTSATDMDDRKAIRIANGGIVPENGLTIASENGIYIQGDLNTGTTDPSKVDSNSKGNKNNDQKSVAGNYQKKPVAIAGDMVTILSNNWKDSNSDKSVSSRTATNTTINAAIISGYLPGGWVNKDGTKNGYSGGANNFPRFLEDWNGKYFTYYGSMIQLYNSEMFTGRWETSGIYGAPNRRWNFETLFESVAPPGEVNVTAFSRGSWQRF